MQDCEKPAEQQDLKSNVKVPNGVHPLFHSYQVLILPDSRIQKEKGCYQQAQSANLLVRE